MEAKKKSMLAPCGIYCGGCGIHLRTDEELEYWKQQKVDLNSIKCDGCRSGPKERWSSDCEIFDCCVITKKLMYCSECDNFPCIMIENWIGNMEHHRKAIERLKAMKEYGTDKWLTNNGYK